MLESFTAGAKRALDRAQARAQRRGVIAVEPVDLLAALMDEEESRASELLLEMGLEAAHVWDVLGTTPLGLTEAELEAFRRSPLPNSSSLRAALNDAAIQARAFDRAREIGTEHLLNALVSSDGAVADALEGAGVRPQALIDRLTEPDDVEAGPIPLASEFAPLDLGEPVQAIDLARILDASANRAREGLRVVEDFVRFALDDPGLTRRLKEIRHRLAGALSGLDPELLIDARDTRGDVGTHIMSAAERVRENSRSSA
jgi:thiamine-phosphate pyrophosphorylase